MVFLFCFFFFQAEDGIRDIGVTGVQTCALPISHRARRQRRHTAWRSVRTRAGRRASRRSEEHTSEPQSRQYLVCRLLLEKKKKKINTAYFKKKKKKKLLQINNIEKD